MKYLIVWISVIIAGATLADEVRLKDGRSVRGRILSETQYELEIETARSDDGTIRHVQVIDQTIVDSMARGEFSLPAVPFPISQPEEAEQPIEMETMDFDSIESWLESGIGTLQEGRYDQAVQRYRRVLDHPELVTLSREENSEARRALELRSRALRLTQTALEGKIDYLEEQEVQAKERVELALRQAEDDLRDYERDQKRDEGRRDIIEMRSRQRMSSATGLEAYKNRVEQAKAQQVSYQAWSRRTALEVQNLKSEVELLEELEDQLKDSLKRKFR